MSKDKLQGEREANADHEVVKFIKEKMELFESMGDKVISGEYCNILGYIRGLEARAALASNAQPQAPKVPDAAKPVAMLNIPIKETVWPDGVGEFDIDPVFIGTLYTPAFTAPPSTAQAVEAALRKAAKLCRDKATKLGVLLVDKAHGAETAAELCDEILALIPTEAAQPIVPNATRGDTDPPKESGDLWTAGINLGRHGNAIECYRDTRQEAEALRDKVLEAITSPPSTAQGFEFGINTTEGCGMTLEEVVKAPIEHQIGKHGNLGGFDNAEDYINSLEPFELLKRISNALEEMGVGL